MDRVALFIDGASMFYAQRENGWQIDYKKVYDHFTDSSEVYGAFYFTATPPAGNPEKVERYRRFRRALIHIGFTVVDKEVKVIKDYATGQTHLKGNLDVELVFRMLAGIEGYDRAVLFGGDADFVPVINHLRNMGKEVICVGRRQTTAIDLINATSDFKDLEQFRHIIEKTRRPADNRPYNERAAGNYQRGYGNNYYRRTASSPDGSLYGAKLPYTNKSSPYEERPPSYGDAHLYDDETNEKKPGEEKETESGP
jgi:uncharacterized LabA/DUF88 family protein